VRLAFLSPLPPAATGIADYSAEVLALLAERHELDVFHDQRRIDLERLPRASGVLRAETFLARHRERGYDAAIYQLGNGPTHAFLWEPLARVPGLLVLHDLVLHHARAAMFLDTPEARAYRQDPASAALRRAALAPLSAYQAELAYAYPAQAGRLAEAQLGSVGTLLPYAYPLFRLPVEASRVTAVHNRFMADAVRGDVPQADVVRIPHQAEARAIAPGAVRALRARLALPENAFVVGSFGLLTPEKGIETLARAVARAAATLPQLRLLLVGPSPDRPALEDQLGRLGVLARTVIAGRVPFEELPAHMECAHLAVHLRYPTARETSGALLRLLAQGRPTVISDLEHWDEIPMDAVIRADVTDEEGAVTRAILRLAERSDARARLGARAAGFVRREHAPARTLAGYEAALALARERPDPPSRAWPSHWPTADARPGAG
jgi:glycosyltransferase involved in cell wall biosynthesis